MRPDTILRGFSIEVESSTTDPNGGQITCYAIVPDFHNTSRLLDEHGNPLDCVRFTVVEDSKQ
jgi:hypothetical protein